MNQSGVHIADHLPSHPANTAILNLLLAAEKEYVRHYDLFSNTYFKNNPDKRELAARRYALLKTCNELAESKTYTIKEVFEVYQGFPSANIKNYKSFSNKLKEFRQSNVSTCIHKRIDKVCQEAYKLNPYVANLIHSYLSDPAYHSYNSIKGWVNINIQEFNEKHGTELGTISKSAVATYYLQNRNEINYYRKGKQRFDTETRPYLPRITARHAGSLYQMDGTPVQIFCWNHESKWKTEGKQRIRLNLFAIRDAYSGKITGFDMSEEENRWNIIEALKMSVSTQAHLPAEIVSDNFSASKTDEYKAIKKHMEDKGVVVRAAKVGNAQDKGEIERFWGTFQSKFQRLIDGYIGEGIRSKRDNGRISEEFITKCQKQNGLYTYDEMIRIIAELILIYNNSTINEKYGDKTPNQLYAESEKPYVKNVDPIESVQMFWLNKEVTVKKSMIINEVHKSKRYYEVWDNELKLQLNGQKVRIYYDEDDASDIHVFTLDDKYICTCSQHAQIHEAFVDQEEGEKERIMRHVSHRDSIYKVVENKADERIKKAEKFIGQDFSILTPLSMEKRKINDSENQALLKHFLDNKGVGKDEFKERVPVGSTYQEKELKEKSSKKSSKGVHSSPATYDKV